MLHYGFTAELMHSSRIVCRLLGDVEWKRLLKKCAVRENYSQRFLSAVMSLTFLSGTESRAFCDPLSVLVLSLHFCERQLYVYRGREGDAIIAR
ncbi:hypothetical protein ROHU_023987 [Labeo rohita]|uniref:Uncharacterized protein n=1 Tax=Labeo rohita TaxID=84645 RepID=A0A498MK58_LABRO|nr:hypothetical protein ROHU_023987 [Labeo rohita]